tara:strand:- start:304 stop:588 length:285 start_codon:yes stop_codon:yes gene_type:complete
MNKKIVKIYSITIISIALIITIVINLVDFEAIVDKAEEEVKEKVEEVKQEVQEKIDVKKEEVKEGIEEKKNEIHNKIDKEKEKLKNKFKGLIDA